MAVDTIEEKIRILEEQKQYLQNYIYTQVNNLVEQRRQLLIKGGADVHDPDMVAYINQSLETYKNARLKTLGKNELDSLDAQIQALKEGKEV